MNFSIILASRERTHLLDPLLHSIQRTTSDPGNTEVLVCIDEDDRQTLEYTKQVKACKFSHFFVRPRQRNLNHEYLNWAWKNHSSGKFVIICNDDCLFQTPNWDQIILHKLNAYLADKPDGVVYGWISDSLIERAGGLNYCCFPLVSRSAGLVLNWIMPPEFDAWGADIGLWRVYNCIGRVCDLSEMLIDHISYHSGKRERDEISRYVQQISRKSINPIVGYDIKSPTDTLHNYIQKFK